MAISNTSSAPKTELHKEFEQRKTTVSKSPGAKSGVKDFNREEELKDISSAEKEMSFSALKPKVNGNTKPEDKKNANFAEKVLGILKGDPAKFVKKAVGFLPIIGLFDLFDSQKSMGEKMQTIIGLSAIALAPLGLDKFLEPALEKMIPDKNDLSFNPDTDMIFPNEEFKQTLFNGIARFLEATNTSGVSLNLSKLKKKSPTMLFTGPPGVGKTEMAKFTAKKMGRKLKFISASEISAFIGETEKNIIKAFQEAKRNNMLLFFDEADTFVSQRSDVPISGSAKHDNNVVNTILKQIDESGVPCVFATNSGNVDKAFKDRMKVTIAFPEATPGQNYGILLRQLVKLEMKKEHLDEFIKNQDRVIKLLAGTTFSPRDMYNVIEEAVEIVSQRVSSASRTGTTVSERETSITLNDLDQAVARISENKEASSKSNMGSKNPFPFS
ncbi:MAG: AAA family ATPase [Candidatus Caenarcaniphilales bacterium]|nr:AAA family ATPase [Candidatus Caenarcaniphilales bacterium]